MAARGGQAIGGLMVIGGIALAMTYFRLFGFSGAWLALIGAFLFIVATATYRQERNREELRHYRVGDVMMSNLSNLPSNAPSTPPLAGDGLAGLRKAPMASWCERLRGILARRLLPRAPRQARADTQAFQAIALLDPLNSVGPEDSVSQALERMESGDMGRMAVMRDGQVLGFISREDVLRFARNLRRRRT